jgi:hypothetical protein
VFVVEEESVQVLGEDFIRELVGEAIEQQVKVLYVPKR